MLYELQRIEYQEDTWFNAYYNQIKNELHNEVYRFKIIIGALKKDEDQKYHILIFADDAEGKKHQYDIKFADETKDF